MEYGAESSGKEFKNQKKIFKGQGYNTRTAKRMAREEVYAKGGVVKTSTKKTKHRGKTTNGGYGNGM